MMVRPLQAACDVDDAAHGMACSCSSLRASLAAYGVQDHSACLCLRDPCKVLTNRFSDRWRLITGSLMLTSSRSASHDVATGRAHAVAWMAGLQL